MRLFRVGHRGVGLFDAGLFHAALLAFRLFDQNFGLFDERFLRVCDVRVCDVRVSGLFHGVMRHKRLVHSLRRWSCLVLQSCLVVRCCLVVGG